MRPTAGFLLTALLLIAGVVPLPNGLARAVRQSAKSLSPGRASRAATAGSYYEGLINVGSDSGRSELALKLLGKRADWANFHEVGATHYLYGDVLQFELYPNLNKQVLGENFSTNTLGQRDRAYTKAKPPGVFRIVLLGSSMDMGWGVSTDATYENRFEDWLNLHARLCKIDRRFEVMNFAMAAYSPLHRLESLRRKAFEFQPDLVIYSGTLLDPRLLQLHLCGLLQARIPIPDSLGFVQLALKHASLSPKDLARGAEKDLKHKEIVKAKLQPELWPLIDGVLGALADDCRSHQVPLWCLLIPRAGDSDLPEERQVDVARYTALARKHALPLFDLTATFDDQDPASIEIAPWDDHPNKHGHDLLFRALAERIIDDRTLYRMVFGVEENDETIRLARQRGAQP